MQIPPTRYVDRRGRSLAYQAFGQGPRALVMFQEVVGHLDLLWTDPVWVEQAARLAARCRVMTFQQMGVGLSDRIDRVPTLEEQASDVEAVMDAEGVARAVLYAPYTTTMPLLLFAAQHPERVDGLVLWCPVPQGARHSGPEATAGYTPEEAQAVLDAWDGVFGHWGEGRTIDVWNPVIADRTRPTMAMLERTSASPVVAAAVYQAAVTSDVRAVLPLIHAPTRVLYHRAFSFPEAPVRLVADLIPDATFHMLPPAEPYMSLIESSVPVIDHMIGLVAGEDGAGGDTSGRELLSLLFTDVVGSTSQVARVGDAAWGETLRRHEHAIRRRVAGAGGELLQMIGDGSLSVFPGPAAAIRTAREIEEEATELGLTLRAGVHTGECERRGGDVAGLAVHIAARVGAAAAPGEVWVSRTVRDLVGGSGLNLQPRGAHELRGVDEPWELFALASGDADVSVPPGGRALRPADRVVMAAARRAPRLLRAATRLDNARRRRAAG